MKADDRRATFINALILVKIDGVSDPRERAVLWRFKEATGLTDADAVTLSRGVLQGELGPQVVTTTGAALEMVELLAEIAAADGELAPAERAFVLEVASLCGISNYTVEQILDRHRPQPGV